MKFSVSIVWVLSIHSICDAQRLMLDTVGVDETEATFKFYSRQNQNSSIILVSKQLKSYTLDPMLPYKFIIHGYTDNGDNPWIIKMKDEYFKKGEYNVIAVDWSKTSNTLYPLTVANARNVGDFIGEFLINLNELANVSYENMHLIGHSLGGHIAGFAGKFVINNKGRSIGRITGMDPAGPGYLTATDENRLCSGDAQFVDVIHTDRGKYGYFNELGNIDFYPNGGVAPQPGCYFRNVVQDFASCSHIRTLFLYMETINSIGFVSKLCNNILNYENGECETHPTAIMGENVDLSSSGSYYLTTNDFTPFARNGKI